MIHYVKGDATQPIHTPALIMHICNDAGYWGKGFVLSLSKRWKKPEMAYKILTNNNHKPQLGYTLFVAVEPDIVIANIIGQHDIRPIDNVPPIRYDALATAFNYINTSLKQQFIQYTIHAPRLGSGLAGGDWTQIEALINEHLLHQDVYIYDYVDEADRRG